MPCVATLESENPLKFLLPDWPAPSNVRAVMTTRHGGGSSGMYSSLNLGARTDDDPAQVSVNRQRLRQELSLPSEPAWLEQVHGTQAVRLPGELPRAGADASFTTAAGPVCTVLAADCLPVLLADEAGTVVAAAHAGWRGLAAGVLEETIRALPVAPATLMAWLGPAIGSNFFDVGPEVLRAFTTADAGAAAGFRSLPGGKFKADLFWLARRRLAAAGVERVFGGGVCTYENARDFYSYRRDGACGRMAALIWLTAEQ